jgi:hypothetical protein
MMPRDTAIWRLWIRASYSTLLLEAWFRPLLGRGHLDFCPFIHKVCEDLQLDHLSRTKFDLKLSKLDRPHDDVAVGVAVANDLSQGE